MRNFLYLFLLLFMVNCAHLANKTPDGNPLPDEKLMTSGDEEGGDDSVVPGPEDEQPMKVGHSTPLMTDLSDTETDMKMLPEDFNQNVNMWIDYFQGKGRKHMVRYLGRSTRYVTKMKEIFRSHGLPEDLVYLALIESGFSSKALSHARAAGYWQFIRGTARRYDLRIDYYTDERSDFIASTEAAAQYLKALYNLFGSWYLAIASYNVGENRVKSLVMKYYTRDFWELARKRKLPRETIHYVPKFLAARMIAKHPEKYGFTTADVEYQAPLEYQEIKFDKAVSLMSLAPQLGMNYEELHGLNPAYKKGVIPKYGESVIVRVPSQLRQEQVLAALGNSSTAVALNQATNDVEEREYSRYRIRNGDTLSTISRRFRVSMSHLIEVNDLSRRTVLRVGRVLRIPKSQREISSQRKPSSMKVRPKNAKSNVAKVIKMDIKKKAVKQKTHVVRNGDTLVAIANKYNVRMSKLIATNGLKQSGKILIGSRLVIPH